MNIKIILCIMGFVIAAFPLNAFGAGACCDGDIVGLCFMADDEFGCTEGGDETWMGEGTTCDPNPCQQGPSAIPTMTEWGMITFVLFAGLGAVYYLRKRQTAKS